MVTNCALEKEAKIKLEEQNQKLLGGLKRLKEDFEALQSSGM